MKRFEQYITATLSEIIQDLYGAVPEEKYLQVQRTRKDQVGDFTLVVFPIAKISKSDPASTALALGEELIRRVDNIQSFDVVKGFLNLILKPGYWLKFFNESAHEDQFGQSTPGSESPLIMVEYSSPNTNKPLHLGHIRNNLLGYSVSQILKANGYRVKMVNLVNDRGIHICKSMLAWQKWGNGETPESTGIKGDQLVGKYYVEFDKALKQEINQQILQGVGDEEAEKSSPLMREAQQMLVQWEDGNEEVTRLWQKMNSWVYQGFDETYRNLGIYFDKIYYESETYRLGKELVMEGLAKGVLYRKEDGSVWADLTDEGLDHKLLLRADGTSVYMTQDLGTAHQRYEEATFNKHVYVVGNEQIYHFKVLRLILKKLGFEWADRLHHLSYGMVELPEGKMKSREGKVVDADDLIDEMVQSASQVSAELGKLDGMDENEKEVINYRIAMGALKYFILKVDPTKTMLFNPAESIDFNGNTGPFIQYTYVRTKSVIHKASELGMEVPFSVNAQVDLSDRESGLLKSLYQYPELLREAGNQYSPAIIANYLYELVKDYNHFYQTHPVVKEIDKNKRDFRLALTAFISKHIKDAMLILGIEMPDKM